MGFLTDSFLLVPHSLSVVPAFTKPRISIMSDDGYGGGGDYDYDQGG